MPKGHKLNPMGDAMQKKRIALFGSTGSIGTQAIEVIRANPDLFETEILTAQSNDALLIKQALELNPNAVVIGDESKYKTVKDALASTDIKVFAGEAALVEVADFDSYDMMLAGIVGFAGLKPTLKAIEKGKAVGLAFGKYCCYKFFVLCQIPCKRNELLFLVLPAPSVHRL